MIAYDTDVLVELYEQTFVALRSMPLLSYTRIAEAQFQAWRQLKVRGSTHDLRIAAICVASSAKLITRNRRDLEQSPDSVWKSGSDPWKHGPAKKKSLLAASPLPRPAAWAERVNAAERVAQESVERNLERYTTRAVGEEMFRHVEAGRFIDQVRETRREWTEHRFHDDFRIPIAGRRIYIETILMDDDPEDPTIHVVSIHEA